MEQIIAFFVEQGAKNPDGTLVHKYGTTIQALGVTAGGLLGVFLTLTIFFLFIWGSVKLSKKS